MKLLPATLLITLALASPADPEPALSYFTNLRDVTIAAADRQNYIIVDEDIWNHARPELADLRLYDNGTQEPLVLAAQRGGTSSEERPAKNISMAAVGGRTVHDLELGQIAPVR